MESLKLIHQRLVALDNAVAAFDPKELLKARTIMNMSCDELGRAMGVSGPLVSIYENGRRKAPARYLSDFFLVLVEHRSGIDKYWGIPESNLFEKR